MRRPDLSERATARLFVGSHRCKQGADALRRQIVKRARELVGTSLVVRRNRARDLIAIDAAVMRRQVTPDPVPERSQA